jgi:hypothetical protein
MQAATDAQFIRIVRLTKPDFAPGLGHGNLHTLFIALVAFLPAALNAPEWPFYRWQLSGTSASGFRSAANSGPKIVGYVCQAAIVCGNGG